MRVKFENTTQKESKTSKGDNMKLFKPKEEKNIANVLSKITDSEAALCLEELHGLLFGIAITPDPITSNEWLSAVFGKKPPFDDDETAETGAVCLLEACKRMTNEGIKGKLVFPFNYNRLTNEEFPLLESWTRGLFLGLSLRPHIWRISKEYENVNNKEISSDMQKVIDSGSIITTIAVPEERVGIYEPIPGLPAKSPDEVMEMLFIMLPAAVEILRQYGVKLRQENTPMEPAKKKIGRKDTGSGESGKASKKSRKN
ncbi:MAG: YecA family protein [Smithellaceae bacterium]